MRSDQNADRQGFIFSDSSEVKESIEKSGSLLKLWKNLNEAQKHQLQGIFNENLAQSIEQKKLETEHSLSKNQESLSSQKTQRLISQILKAHLKPQKKVFLAHWKSGGLLNQNYYCEACPKPLTVGNITLKSILSIPYQTLFRQLIQISEIKKLSINEQTKRQKIDDIMHLLQHASQCKFTRLLVKSQILCSILTVISPISFPFLKILSLSCCEITSIEMIIWMEMPCLIHLNLEWNLITTVKSFSKVSFEKNNNFSTIWFNNNMINQFDKFSRMGIRKLQSCRTDSIPNNSEQAREIFQKRISNDAQSQDLSFLMKKPFDAEFLRIGNKKRIPQTHVLCCIYRIDKLMHLS